MPRVEEIPRERWVSFFDEFSREHEGWPVDIEIADAPVSNRIESNNVPLQGISADLKGTGIHDITITVGQEPAPGLTHIIEEASSVRLHRSDAGTEEALQIQSADGETTILRLRAVAGRHA